MKIILFWNVRLLEEIALLVRVLQLLNLIFGQVIHFNYDNLILILIVTATIVTVVVLYVMMIVKSKSVTHGK